MANTLKGSTTFHTNGGYTFTPYNQGDPENVSWVNLKEVDNGKLLCTKKLVRIQLTVNRSDLANVCSRFNTAFSQLSNALMLDPKVRELYELAKTMKPYEIKTLSPLSLEGEGRYPGGRKTLSPALSR